MAVFILPTARAIFPKNGRKESPEAETGRKTAQKSSWNIGVNRIPSEIEWWPYHLDP